MLVRRDAWHQAGWKTRPVKGLKSPPQAKGLRTSQLLRQLGWQSANCESWRVAAQVSIFSRCGNVHVPAAVSDVLGKREGNHPAQLRYSLSTVQIFSEFKFLRHCRSHIWLFSHCRSSPNMPGHKLRDKETRRTRWLNPFIQLLMIWKQTAKLVKCILPRIAFSTHSCPYHCPPSSLPTPPSLPGLLWVPAVGGLALPGARHVEKQKLRRARCHQSSLARL